LTLHKRCRCTPAFRASDYLGQYISLAYEVNEQSHVIDGGEIMHSNVYLYNPDRAINTRTAIQRVEDFRKENFGEPLPQTQSEK
jgi:hypothetical protein